MNDNIFKGLVAELKIGSVIAVPCRNYDGWTYAKIKSVNAMGLVAVKALVGEPWTTYTHGGWATTAYQTFYPDAIRQLTKLLKTQKKEQDND